MHVTKLSILKEHIAAGRNREALKLAASWGRRGLGSGAHADAITQAWAAASNPAFYKEIGKDPEHLEAEGIRAIKERYEIT